MSQVLLETPNESKPATAMPLVAVIVLNWNGLADTLECLASLMQDDYPRKHIIVFDNGSSDDSVRVIRERYPSVEALQSPENLGFAGGNNRAIVHAQQLGADFVFLLNNDTVILSDTLRTLVRAAAEHPEAGMITPVISYFDDPAEPWFDGSKLELSRGLAIHEHADVSQKYSEIPWASGCALLISRAVLERVKGFDERFFLNWEDVDLSLRVRAMGRKIIMVAGPQPLVRHKVNRTIAKLSGRGVYYHVRNGLLVARLHAGPAYPLAALRIMGRSLREAFRAKRRGDPDGQVAWKMTWRAILDHFRGSYGKLAE